MPNSADKPAYRSGVAARLAGLSVETLRVWERRYGVSDTQRSEHGQRLYSAEQVRRLGLLKQLVDSGHAIGTVARLPIDKLEELTGANGLMGPIRVAVVGDGLARRIAAAGREARALNVQRTAARLELAAELAGAEADLLLAELSEPDEGTVAQIVAAREHAGASSALVLYRFCSAATIRALRAEGCLVARVPAETGELVMLCRAALAGQQVPPAERQEPTVAPRRFDEAALAAITAAGNRLSCECPRHLSELLLMLGSFERYSAQCASRNEADAQLHRELGLATGQARMLLEDAMDRLVVAEGLPVAVPPSR